jgi:regulator of sirC expression with transglutaminase-like and TPR domain
MKDNELHALASLLDDDDKTVLLMVEKQIYAIGSPMIPFLAKEIEKKPAKATEIRIKKILADLRLVLVMQRLTEWKNTDQKDLLAGLWAISSYQYPTLDIKDLKIQIEQLYYDIWQVMREDLHPYDQIKIMNSIFFGKQKFQPNPDFQSIDNSMINKVLENRLGNPITLCCVYILLAEKLKLPIYGVNLPNIFMLMYNNDLYQFYINPTNKGVIFHRSDIENYIEQLAIPNSEDYYIPCQNIDILKRILRNLGYAFEKQNLLPYVTEVKQILNVLS